jgi:purine nucleoside phosphorylase
MTKAILGVIGGSGIYDLPGLEGVREEHIASPWGEPSAALRIGEIAGLPVVFLSATTRDIGCRPPTSTIGPISTCSSGPA